MKVQTTGRLLLDSVFRRKKMILIVAFSILGTVLVGSLLSPPSYEATSTVLVRGSNYEHVLFPEPRHGGPTTFLVKPQEQINSEIEIIKSRPVLERVVKALKLEARKNSLSLFSKGSNRNGFEAAVNRLRDSLRVEPVIESQVIRIAYRDSDPVMASQVVNQVAEAYLRQHLDVHLNRAESSFYAEQMKSLEAEVTGLRQQLAKMKSEENVVAFNEQAAAFVSKIKTLDLARANVQTEIASRRSKVERIQKLLKSNPNLLIPMPEIAKNPIIEMLENKLVNLRFHLESVRQRYTEESRQVITAREQVQEVERQIKSQVRLFLEREAAELEKLQAEEQALTRTIESLNTQIKRFAATESGLANLERQIEDKQKTLTVLRERYQDALVAQGTDYRLQAAKIVSLASVPTSPVFPNLLLNMVLAVVLAIAVSLGLAFFAEYWDDSIKVPEDVERYLGLPVLASVPEL
ncbi:MAG: GumC family protein [Deltaproteobacteria bacterium]|nr:GumC family protein [Deltaproteobacteria bacterium]